VAERLLHHDPGPLGQAGAGQALNHATEQRRRDLEIEDGGAIRLDGLGEAVIGPWVGVMARDHREALREALPSTSITIGVTSSGMTRCSITDISGRANTPPLNAAIGVLSCSGSISIDMPRGGRPLVLSA
jgi:hypothetical protein